nr:hypothetical protein [Halothiobacillus sp.]
AQLYNSGNGDAPAKKDTVAFASMMGSFAAALTGQNAQGVAIASGTAAIAAQNNFLGHYQQVERDRLRAKVAAGTATLDEKKALVLLEISDQVSDGLLNKLRSNQPLSQDDIYNLNTYLAAYEQQDGQQATQNLLANGKATDWHGYPFAGSKQMQTNYMDAFSQANGGGFGGFLIADLVRPTSENEFLFNTAKRESGMGGSFVDGVIFNDAYLPSAHQGELSTIDALRNSPILATGTYLIGKATGANSDDLSQATMAASQLSDVGASFLLPRIGIGPAFGTTTSRAVEAGDGAAVGAVSKQVDKGAAVATKGEGLPVTEAGRPIEFDGQFYSADGFKFSSSYYDRLWSSGGRPAPFLQARAIMDSNPTVTPDPRGAAGYFRYEGAGMEMIYNPTTGQVGHIQPLR